MKHIIKILLGLALAIVGAQAQSTPINLTPIAGDGDIDATWQGTVPNNPDADDIETIVGTTTQLLELYKADVADYDKDTGAVIKAQSESGSFASSYDTT